MMGQEDFQLPAALRMAANPSRGRKYVMGNDADGAHQSPARRVTGSSHRGRTYMGREEEGEGPLLPSALRIAANSGLGKKKKKHDDRMELKNDAKAMRQRLAEMDDQSDQISAPKSPSVRTYRSSSRGRGPPTKSLSIDISRSRPASSYRPTKSKSIDTSRSRPTRNSRPMKSLSADTMTDTRSCGSSGKYSNELLNKKIKKVKKMLNESTPGSKEFKSLEKKLAEYSAQLREQEQRRDSSAAMNDSFNISEIEGKEMTAEQDHSESLSDHTVEEDYVPLVRVEEKVEEQEDSNTYSLDILKKKLKKVEKMISKHTPDSKEYKKLQKKRTEYEKQISEQDGKGAKKNRHEQSEGPETVRKDSIRYQPGLSWQRPPDDPEHKPSLFNNHPDYGQDETLKKHAYLEEARKLKQDALEKKRRANEREKSKKRNSSFKSVASQSESSEDKHTPIYWFADSQTKKQEYLEEARRLKQEAMEKKRKEEESRKKAETQITQGDDESQSESSESESPEENEVPSNSYADRDSKKQEYLEEARRLKQEAMEIKRKEEESRKITETCTNEADEDSQSESSESESPEEYDVPSCSYADRDSKKQEYLEEARRLKQEAMETKRREEESPKKAEAFINKVDEDSQSESIESESPEENKVPSYSYTDRDPKKQEYLEEARRLKEKAMAKKPNESVEAIEQENSDIQIVDPVEQEVEEKNDELQQSSSTDSASGRKKPNFLSDIMSNAKGTKKEKQHSDSNKPPSPDKQKKKPNFLSEMMSKAKGAKEDKRSSDLNQYTETTTPQKKPNFFDDIKSRTQKQKTEQINVSQSTDSMSHQEKPNFLDDIKSRTKGVKVETVQGKTVQSIDPTTSRKQPSFLDEIRSKANGAEEEKIKDDTIQSTNSPRQQKKPGFLDDIKTKSGRKREEQPQKSSVSSPEPVAHGRKPSFLEELRLKAGGRTKDEQAAESNPIADQSEPNIPGNSPNYECVEANARQSEKSVISVDSQSSNEEKGASPTEQEGEASKGYLDRRTLPQPLSNNSKKLLRELESNEIRQKKLERSLIQNGIQLTEEISYEEAKDKIAEITESMKSLMAGGMESYTAEKEYFRLEEQLSKYSSALMLTDEYAEEVRRMEQNWEDSIKADNMAAICKLRSHMPVNIRHLTEEQLVATATPNGKTLPRPIARKFKRTNILQLLRVDPDDIEMMHPSLLEGMRTTSLTLTERRALHEHFREVVERWTERRSDPSIEKKWQWYQSLRSKFKETLASFSKGDKWTIKADAAVDYSVDYGYTTEASYESSGSKNESKKALPKDAPLPKHMASKVKKKSEAELMQECRDRLRLDPDESEIDKKLLRELSHSDKRTKTLEKQLTQAGLSLPKEDISYEIAKSRITELTEELNKVAVDMGNTVDKKEQAKLEYTFGKLSQELDKYNNALMLTKEWVKEQKEKEQQWENDVSAANLESLKKVRRHMPVNIRNVSEASLSSDLTPNGKVLPKAIGRKFKRTNILMILRTDPAVIESMHPSSLEAMRTTGLTLTERRALHEHLKEVAPRWKAMSGDKMCERKWMWHASLQSKLKEMIASNEKHIEQYGRPKTPEDYRDDYGYPETAEYEQQAVAKSNLLTMEELEKRRKEDDYY